MPRYLVKAGDHLVALAARMGFDDPKRILEHPDNAGLKGRKNPALLDPGEELTIEAKPKEVSLPTGQTHKIVVQAPKAKLKVSLKTFRGAATQATEAQLTLGGGAAEAVSLDGGALEKPLPDPLVDRAVLAVKGADGRPDLRWKLRLGHLGRIESDDGALARLRNLGYLRSVSGDAEPRERRSAIEEFQADNKLTLSGELDDATRAKLEEIHGC